MILFYLVLIFSSIESELAKQHQQCLKLEAEVVTFQYENEMQQKDIKESETLVSKKGFENKL